MYVKNKSESAIRKEFLNIESQEKELAAAAVASRSSGWRAKLEAKVPNKVRKGLEEAFCKGFEIVFQKGYIVIEKGYDKEALQVEHAARDYAVRCRGSSNDLKQMQNQANARAYMNMFATTAEGVALGMLGIGLPDIVLFLGTLLKGIYETALNYGFEYDEKQEQMLILKMMQTALSRGDAWADGNEEYEEMLKQESFSVTKDDLSKQIRKTAVVFAFDMLLLKFIQGIPVVGALGGAANPVYYNKVMKYVELKYRKRYLMKIKEQTSDRDFHENINHNKITTAYYA